MPKRRMKIIKQTFDPRKSIRVQGRTCTRKRTYETESEAEFEADIRYIRYYKCPFCKGYHLTSKEQKQ
jgi:hypothetical protein